MVDVHQWLTCGSAVGGVASSRGHLRHDGPPRGRDGRDEELGGVEGTVQVLRADRVRELFTRIFPVVRLVGRRYGGG